jgi:hypothetical protein
LHASDGDQRYYYPHTVDPVAARPQCDALRAVASFMTK